MLKIDEARRAAEEAVAHATNPEQRAAALEKASGVEIAELSAVAACIVVVVVTRNLVASLAAGMITLWILVWLL